MHYKGEKKLYKKQTDGISQILRGRWPLTPAGPAGSLKVLRIYLTTRKAFFPGKVSAQMEASEARNGHGLMGGQLTHGASGRVLYRVRYDKCTACMRLQCHRSTTLKVCV